MLTTGFKLWFGFFLGAVLAAVFAGYTSGATETGPLSLGWKGGVGNHVSYTILATGAGVLALLGLVAVAFRDADAEAQADFLGLEEAPPAQAVVGNSLWPVFGATNQVLAAFTLMLCALYLRQCGKNPASYLLPALFVMTITISAMGIQVHRDLGAGKWMVGTVGGIIGILTVWVALEAGLAWRRGGAPRAAAEEAAGG